METVYFRKFEDADAQAVSDLLRRNFLEVNSRDYPPEMMNAMAEEYTPDKIRQIAGYAHFYVAQDAAGIAGCGAISSFWGSLTESILLTIFVRPELQGCGLGRRIVETLEQDEYFLRASRVEIPASYTAAPFYEKLGYQYKDGIRRDDGEGHYRMEKFRTKG